MIFIAILLPGIAAGLISLLWKLLKKPIKWAFKLLLHALSGFVFLLVLNGLGAAVGIRLDPTWPSAVVAGVFGIPGVAALLIFKYIL